MPVHPVTLAVVQLAGRIEGEQEAKGVQLAFEDLLIGATALYLGYNVATLNVRDFQRVPGLTIVQFWRRSQLADAVIVNTPQQAGESYHRSPRIGALASYAFAYRCV